MENPLHHLIFKYNSLKNRIGLSGLLMLLGWTDCFAQNIGINNTGAAPAASAILDVNATDKGLLIPRLSAAQRDAIASPASGLFIYNTSSNKPEYWNGTSWVQLSGSIVVATNQSGTNTGRSVVISGSAASSANPSAILDIQSATGGLLLPRMTTVQRNAIVAPVAGLLIYNTTTNLLNFYSSSGWTEICGTSVSAVTGAVTTSTNIGINTGSPHPSAILEVSSSAAGMAIPRLTSAQRDLILSPAQGLLLYNTTTQSINVYDGVGNWLIISAQAIPSAPTTGTHTPSSTQIIWNWNTVSNASGYKWNTANDYSTATDNGANTSYTQTGLTCNTSYTLYVWAYNCGGNSSSATLLKNTSDCLPTCGTQVWMAANLDAGTMVNNKAGENNQPAPYNYKYCYNNVAANCAIYGGLYEWNNAMLGAASVNCDPCGNNGVQGMCPPGFHIPTDLEWSRYEFCLESTIEPKGTTTLATFQTTAGDRGTNSTAGPGDKMKVTSNDTPPWNGTNASGFSALPAGGSNALSGSFVNLGLFTWFWSATDYSTTSAWSRGLSHNNGRSDRYNLYLKTNGFSVRCLQN